MGRVCSGQADSPTWAVAAATTFTVAHGEPQSRAWVQPAGAEPAAPHTSWTAVRSITRSPSDPALQLITNDPASPRSPTARQSDSWPNYFVIPDGKARGGCPTRARPLVPEPPPARP